MDAQKKYEIIKSLVDHDGNKQRAATLIGCSRRTIDRLVLKYKKEGKAGFLHGNTGRKPSHALSEEQKAEVTTLYLNKYWDANFTHACELLLKHDNVSISPTSLRKFLFEEQVLSPKANRSTKRDLNRQLRTRLSDASSKKEQIALESAILALEDAHPRRPRCSYFGEMLQMDASVHLWFGDQKAQLHIAIDDATSTIVGAYFDWQETLNGYYHVLHQILNNYGIPAMFYTDKRTVFEYQLKQSKQIEQDTFTQFGYACKQLGIDIRTTSVAQAKGRVERAFQTLQTRLPVELRLAGVKTLSQANVFLNSYIKEYNAKFSIPVHHIKSVFEMQPDFDTVNQTLAVIGERKIDHGHSLRYKNEYLRPLDANGYPVHFRPGTKAMVIEAFDGKRFSCIEDNVYVLESIPAYESSSKEFDLAISVKKPQKQKIPDKAHPWRSQSFWRYVKMQEHHWMDDITA